MAKPCYVIKIEKVVEVKRGKEHPYFPGSEFDISQEKQPVFYDDITPDEVIDFMNFIINRRKGRHGK